MKRIRSTPQSSFVFLASSLIALAACGGSPPRSPATPVAAATASPAPAPAAPVADESFRKTPPPSGTDAPFVAPKIQEEKLKNGVRILFVERHDLPIVAFDLAFDRGADQDKPGVGAFAGAMLLRGTRSRTALQISDDLQKLGASASAGVDYDASSMGVKCLSSKFGDALTLAADVVQNPAFSKDEIERERSQRLTAIAQQADRPTTILSNVVGETLYPANHPYASSLLGTADAVKKITAGDLARFHGEAFRPDRLTVAVAGDATLLDVVSRVEKAFGGWKGHAPKALVAAVPPPPKADDPKVILVDRPGAPQSNVSLSLVGVPRSNTDFDAILLMNTILGGAFTSRLNLNLREAHAYTYGASSSFDFRHGPGPFRAGGAIVREKTGPAVKEMLKEIDRIRTEPVTDVELAEAKSHLVRSLPASFETMDNTARTEMNIAVYGLPLDEYATRQARIGKVTADDVKRVAATYLVPGAFRLVVVGDAKVIQSDLGEAGLGQVTLHKVDVSADKAKTEKKPAPTK